MALVFLVDVDEAFADEAVVVTATADDVAAFTTASVCTAAAFETCVTPSITVLELAAETIQGQSVSMPLSAFKAATAVSTPAAWFAATAVERSAWFLTT